MSRFGDCPRCGRGLWLVSTVHRYPAPGVTETTITYECRDVMGTTTGTTPSACDYRREKSFTRRVPETLEELHGMSRKDRRAHDYAEI